MEGDKKRSISMLPWRKRMSAKSSSREWGVEVERIARSLLHDIEENTTSTMVSVTTYDRIARNAKLMISYVSIQPGLSQSYNALVE